MSKVKSQKLLGFTIIEAVVFLFIFVVSVLSLYQAFNVGMNYSIESKKKLQAITLANETIEKMRNLGFENIVDGTVDNEQVVRSGVTYYVTTRTTYVDDSIDGACLDTDVACEDYYKIGVQVNWVLNNNNKKINISAVIVPPIREEDANKGYMRLHVIDQNGDGLPFASVSVREIADNKLVYGGPVNSSGNIFLNGLNPGNHKITVGGSDNYYPVETMDTTASFDPYDKHADIIAKNLKEKYIQTDKESTLHVSLKSTFDETISNLGFEIEGGKYLGMQDGTTQVYDFDDSVTNSDGTENFSNMCFGPYFFNFTDLNDGTNTYQFLWMDPITDAENKISLDADTTLEAKAVMAKESVPSLLATILDSADDSPIPGAKVRLQFSGAPVYNLELVANEFGKVYFPEHADEIINDTYDITVTVDGYSQKDEDKTVTINNFTTKVIKLDAS